MSNINFNNIIINNNNNNNNSNSNSNSNSNNNNEPCNKKIICFLSVTPALDFFDFAARLQNDTYDVYVVVDNNCYASTLPSATQLGIKGIIAPSEIACAADGFYGSLLYKQNKPCARDKALYYFSVIAATAFMWLIEEDVFVPSVTTITDLDTKYPTGDLLCKEYNELIHFAKDIANSGWHWAKTVKPRCRYPLPWAATMISAVRISPCLLQAIAAYARCHKCLFMDEALFPTVAIHANLDIQVIAELQFITYRNTFDADISLLKRNYLYHPMKNVALHNIYREFGQWD